jgi:hypothetical protein
VPFRFRRRIGFGPFSINIGRKGVTSVSLHKTPVTITVSRTGTRTSVSLPGTGWSWWRFWRRK